MPGLLDLCEKYYKAKNLYDVLKIDKNASEKEIKKAYHRLSLKVHPDRVGETEKLEATEKFKVLGKVHAILSDKNKKDIYDETGKFDEDDDEASERNWEDYWRMLFKPITVEDIVAFEKNYKGSEMEIRDLKKAYVQGKGDMDFIIDCTPFSQTKDEPRLIGIIQGMIDSEEVPSYELFTNEPAKKRDRRHRKAEREAKEVENLNKMVELEKEDDKKENDLALMIRGRQQERGSFLDKLEAKYGGSAKKEKTKTEKRKAPAASERKNLRSSSAKKSRTK